MLRGIILKKIAFGFMCLLVLLLAACGTTEEQDHLVNYINDGVKPLAPLEAEAVRAYEGATGDNYTDDETLYNKLDKEVIPKYSKLVKKVKAIKVNDPEIKKIHQIYIDSAEKQYSAFEMFIEALEKQDAEIVTAANKKLAEGKEVMDQYNKELKALADERKVDLKKK